MGNHILPSIQYYGYYGKNKQFIRFLFKIRIYDTNYDMCKSKNTNKIQNMHSYNVQVMQSCMIQSYMFERVLLSLNAFYIANYRNNFFYFRFLLFRVHHTSTTGRVILCFCICLVGWAVRLCHWLEYDTREHCLSCSNC